MVAMDEEQGDGNAQPLLNRSVDAYAESLNTNIQHFMAHGKVSPMLLSYCLGCRTPLGGHRDMPVSRNEVQGDIFSPVCVQLKYFM